MIKINILILNYNQKKFIDSCILSIRNQAYKREMIGVIFIDNNSTDGSAEYVKKKYSDIKVIENNSNPGYGVSYNNVLKKIFADGEELALLINVDIELDSNCINDLVGFYSQKKLIDSRVGLIQPTILLKDNPNLINTNGNIIHYLGFGHCGNYRKKYQSDNLYEKEIISVSGACMLISKQYFEDVDGFNDLFFLYSEDEDISWRGLIVGYKHYLVGYSKAYHAYDFSRNKGKMYNEEKNRLIILLTNYSIKSLIILFPIFVFTEILISFYLFINKMLYEKFSSYKFIVNNASSILKKRKYIQKRRCVNDKFIIENFSWDINFQPINNPLTRFVINPIFYFYYLILKIII